MGRTCSFAPDGAQTSHRATCKERTSRDERADQGNGNQGHFNQQSTGRYGAIRGKEPCVPDEKHDNDEAAKREAAAADSFFAEGLEPLSEREIEVLQLISEGLTNQEIAGKLYISLHTVKGHARNIYGKLGVKNRTQAIAKGKSLGILANT